MKPFESLSCGGGGICGLYLLGSLQYLMDKKYIDSSLKKFHGTSIGSMISLFISIGYTAIELMIYICSSKLIEKFKVNNPYSFLQDGIYDYSIINDSCKTLLMNKIGFLPTLGELYEKFGIEIFMTTYNLTRRQKEYLSYKTHADLSVLDALRMSCNIPYIFNEFFYNGDEYIDGGIVDNFPIENTDENVNRLGLFLDTNNFIVKSDESSLIYKIINKIYILLKTPLIERESSKVKKAASENFTIIIIKPELNPFYFNISNEQKFEMFSIGYNSVKI